MNLTGSKHIIHRLYGFVAAVVAAATLAACGSDSPAPPAGEPDGAGMLSIGFRVAAPGAGVSRASHIQPGDVFEEGPGLESHIDFQSYNYRIYFFDENDTYITDWNGPADMHIIAGDNYWIYRFTGTVPEELKSHSLFKVMVLANWPDYPDFHADLDLTVMTITDFVKAEWAKFKAFSSFTLSIPERRLIPFYGLSGLKEIATYEENKTYDIGDIDLLRAVAKVEVTFNGLHDISLKNAPFIVGVNPGGFCAPDREYGNGSDLNNDYISDLHLPFDDNNNHIDATKSGYHMLQTDYNKYIAYLPEFRNIGVGDNYSRINLTLDLGNDRTKQYELNFATYDSNGTTTNNDDVRFDIRRNDLYRFTVTADLHQILFRLQVEEWAPGGRTEIEM